ncbi:MAG: hypothetical protein ABSD89_08680 [Halobacteriota archaeon]|jgi:hypothetical protein
MATTLLNRRVVVHSVNMKDSELISECKATGRALNYDVQSAVDIGAGEIDVVWTKKEHPNLPTFKLGFFLCPTGGEIATDFLTQSVAKALLSVCDKAIFLVRDDASLKSVRGKIQALDAIGGVLQLKKYAHAITSDELLGGIR